LASTAEKDRCIPCEDGRKLLLLALVLRVAWALFSRRFWGYREDGLYDDGIYLLLAKFIHAINSGQIFDQRFITHPPLYPLFLSPFLMLGGDLGVSLARWVQLVISAFTPVLVYRLTLNLRLSRAAALGAGVLLAVDPMFVYFSSRIASETLFAALVAGFFLAWLRAWQSGRARDAALAGLLGGLATLTRGVILPFGGALALVALWRRREQVRWAPLVAVCGLAWAATVAPWTVRNWFHYHRFITVSAQGGWNLYEGLKIESPEMMGEEAKARGIADEDRIGKDDYFGAKANAWIRDNPGEFLKLCAIKALRFWRLAPEPPHGLAARLSAGAFSLALFALALLGLRAVAAESGAWFLLAWVAHLNLLHAVFASNLRYRLPAELVLVVLAGAGLEALLRML